MHIGQADMSDQQIRACLAHARAREKERIDFGVLDPKIYLKNKLGLALLCETISLELIPNVLCFLLENHNLKKEMRMKKNLMIRKCLPLSR